MRPFDRVAIILIVLLASGLFALGQGAIINPQTNASFLTSGILAAARGGAGTISGALKGSGAGVVSQAACADLSNAGTACSAPILQSKIIASTRDLTAVTGSVAYTGVGFVPTSCLSLGAVAGSATYTTFFGMSDSSKASASSAINTTGTFVKGAHLIIAVDASGLASQTADVASYDADGLTLSWIKAGSPTGTFSFNIMCYR